MLEFEVISDCKLSAFWLKLSTDVWSTVSEIIDSAEALNFFDTFNPEEDNEFLESDNNLSFLEFPDLLTVLITINLIY